MMRRNIRRADGRAGTTLLAIGVGLALAFGAVTAHADDSPADSAKAAGEAKADQAKEQAEAAKEAGEAKAEAAKESAGAKKEVAEDKAEAAKDAGEAKAAEAKSKAKARQKATKAKAAKGGAVSEGTKAAPGTMPVRPDVEPQHVQVQHILIAFAGSGTRATRPKEEAKKLAYEVLEKARKGDDFDALVKQYTDDSHPGIYGMSGRGVAKGPGEYERDGMVPAFGNVGFAINPGNIGMADFDPATSPFGWHIIKRLK